MKYYDNKERQEAIDAGKKALSSLRKAKEQLASARGWGDFDIVGGGLLSSLVKHSHMDDAQQFIHAAKYDLQNFHKELTDLNEFDDINLDTQDFWGFADILFDGLIADFTVQNRIAKAQTAVDQAIAKVEDILKKLEEQE